MRLHVVAGKKNIESLLAQVTLKDALKILASGSFVAKLSSPTLITYTQALRNQVGDKRFVSLCCADSFTSRYFDPKQHEWVTKTAMEALRKQVGGNVADLVKICCNDGIASRYFKKEDHLRVAAKFDALKRRVGNNNVDDFVAVCCDRKFPGLYLDSEQNDWVIEKWNLRQLLKVKKEDINAFKVWCIRLRVFRPRLHEDQAR